MHSTNSNSKLQMYKTNLYCNTKHNTLTSKNSTPWLPGQLEHPGLPVVTSVTRRHTLTLILRPGSGNHVSTLKPTLWALAPNHTAPTYTHRTLVLPVPPQPPPLPPKQHTRFCPHIIVRYNNNYTLPGIPTRLARRLVPVLATLRFHDGRI